MIGGQSINWEVIVAGLSAPEVVIAVGTVAGATALYAFANGGPGDCAKALNDLARSTANVLRRISEFDGPDYGHKKACGKPLID